MPDNFDNFDADRLMAQKSSYCGYKYCPVCSMEMIERVIDDHKRLHCPEDNCGFIYYQNPVPAAGIIVEQNGEVLLVKRAHPPKIGWWCIPAGFMEWNEHPSETAIRELREETSLEIKISSFFNIYSGNDDPRTNAVLILYRGEIVSGKPKAADDALEVSFFSLDALPDKIAFEAHIQALADYKKMVID